MDLSLSITFGSSLQIALFVAPILVFISLLFGDDSKLLLVFNPYELITLAMAAFVAASVARDGDVYRTMRNLGHTTPKMLREHYDGLATKKQAAAFFAIMPSKPAKVIPMQRRAAQ